MPTLFDASAHNKPANGKKGANIVATHVPASGKHHTRLTPLTFYAVSPESVRFETQDPEETVELFLRQHVIVNVPWLIMAFVLIIAPSIVFPFIVRFLPIPVQLPPGYILVGMVFWYIATFGFILGNFLYWFFNIYIVTNERVVDIDFMHLLYKRFSQAELNKIQDLHYVRGGIVAAIFDFGNVVVETAGSEPNLEFERVPHPDRVVQTVRNLVEQTKNNI